MLTEDHVRDALKVCFDPELAVNIVDLGVFYESLVVPDPYAPGTLPRYRVQVRLLTRTTDEERQAMLAGQVRNRLAGMYEISSSTVEFVHDLAWTPECMTPAARRQLGLDRPGRQGLVNIQI